MAITGITLLGIGAIGICAAVLLEIKYHEPIYLLMMKIMPLFFGIGGVLLGIALARGP